MLRGLPGRAYMTYAVGMPPGSTLVLAALLLASAPFW